MPNARFLAAPLILLSVIWAGLAHAGDTTPSAVGRVSGAQGAVSLRPAGGEWSSAALNDPIVAGIAVRTNAQGRTTIGLGALRLTLSGASDLEIGRLDDTTSQLALNQ